MVHFHPEYLVHFTPVRVAHFTPESVVHYSPVEVVHFAPVCSPKGESNSITITFPFGAIIFMIMV